MTSDDPVLLALSAYAEGRGARGRRTSALRRWLEEHRVEIERLLVTVPLQRVCDELAIAGHRLGDGSYPSARALATLMWRIRQARGVRRDPFRPMAQMDQPAIPTFEITYLKKPEFGYLPKKKTPPEDIRN